ncbi:MAG: DUF2066 domain-containing protein [Alphaproteobacteria bacterium]|nr:DUF2066 domain-containing protein [Alphaproteobacteria bacterium]
MRTAFLVFLALVLFVPPAVAQDANDAALYQVSDVAVDVTADSAAHARDQAIIQAQRSALDQLLARLGADPVLGQKLDDDAVAALVQAFEVQQERTSAVRYIGTFTVRFKPAAVRNFLGKHGTSYSEVRSKPVVVLPVVNKGGRYVLWEESTPWRTAWEGLVGKGGLVPVVVPVGDLDDIATISTPEAVSGKPEALMALMNKYQAGGALVAVLNADPDKLDPKQDIRIDVMRVDATGKANEAEHLSLPPAADAKAFLAELGGGVKQIKGSMEKGWRESGKAPKGPLAHLPVAVPIASLADWTAIKAKLANVPGVSRINVISLARGAADIDLEFHGDIPPLQTALAGQNLVLEQSPATGGWVLREGTAAMTP